MPSNAPISCVVQFIGLRPRSNTADRMPGRSRGATTPQFLRSREILVDVNHTAAQLFVRPYFILRQVRLYYVVLQWFSAEKRSEFVVGIPAGGFGVGVGPLCARSSWKRRSSRSRRSGDSGWVLSGGLLAFLLYFVAFVLVAVLPLLLVGGLLTHSRHGGRDRGLASAHRPLHRRLSRLGARPPSTPRVRPASTADSPRPATAMPADCLSKRPGITGLAIGRDAICDGAGMLHRWRLGRAVRRPISACTPAGPVLITAGNTP